MVGDPDDAFGDEATVPFVPVARPRSPLRRRCALVVPEIGDGDEALVLLTSGSTGAPKGVVLTHGNAWSNLTATVSAFRRDTRVTPIPDTPKPPNLIANPVSHTAGVVRLLFALYVGRSVVLLRKFDPAAAKAAIDTHGIDNLTINPAMLRMLLEGLPADADLGAVRYASSGTAPLPTALREAFEVRFGIPVLQAYGQTEAFGGIAIENVKDVLAGRRRARVRRSPAAGGRAARRRPRRATRRRASRASCGCARGRRPRGTSATRPTRRRSTPTAGSTPATWATSTTTATSSSPGGSRTSSSAAASTSSPRRSRPRSMADPAVREAVVLGVPDERLGEVPVAVVEADDDAEEILARAAAAARPVQATTPGRRRRRAATACPTARSTSARARRGSTSHSRSDERGDEVLNRSTPDSRRTSPARDRTRRRGEADGYDGLWVSEAGYDPFLQVLQAVEATQRATVGTAIAVAFGRTPLTLAHTAYDLARYCRGPVRARSRIAGEAAHRTSVLHAVVAAGGAHA